VSVDRYSGFHEFVTARGRALSRTAYLLTGDHGRAEDLVQTALARTARHWPRVRDGGNPEGYVRKVLTNEYISQWRRRRVAELPADQLPDRAVTGDDANRVAVRLALSAALRQLPPRQRAVVVLRYYEDLSEAETAELLGVTIGTVKSQAHTGLARMRSLVPDLTEEAVGT
jgi:RNA polymerase sigma-70 factor (sigma-E family)